MTLISVGVDHEHASLEFLERTTVLEDGWSKVLRTLVSHRNIHEAVFVSTCLRTEVVAVVDRFHGAIEEITATLAEATGVATSEFDDRLSVHFDRGVTTHLFSVAAGLKSVVPGEFEILGQLRRALALANDERTAGAELSELFQRAISTGRRVRSETAIARGTTSFAQAAVSMAVQELGPELSGARIVVVGAGQLASGVVKSLLAVSPAIDHVALVNRTVSRAQILADEIGDERLEVMGLEELGAQIAAARLVVVAAEVPTPVVVAAHVLYRSQPVLIVDLGLPRAVSSDVAVAAHVRRVDIGDLRARVERALGGRHGAVEEARALVNEEVEKFTNDQRVRGAAAIVSELREYFDEVVESEMKRREHELDDLSDAQREAVRALLRSIVAKIAHRPTVALKDAAGMDQGIRLTEATRNLFDL
ncbi:MAG: glutamyl-tRNA reductase [Acidimicrobiales bacterium]|jgi:glutamyl-tRNA reductase